MRCKPWQFPAGRQVRNTRFVFVLQFRTQFHSTIGSFLTKPKLSQQQTAFWWVQYRDQRARSGIRSIEPLGLSWSFLSSLAYGELKRTNGGDDRGRASDSTQVRAVDRALRVHPIVLRIVLLIVIGPKPQVEDQHTNQYQKDRTKQTHFDNRSLSVDAKKSNVNQREGDSY